jgi:hypothetical protein
LVLRAGVATGSGRSNGSEAGFSALAVVFCVVCLPVLRGLVVWAESVDAVSKKIAATLRIVRIRVDLFMIAADCIRERVRFESSDPGFPTDKCSDAGFTG